MSHAPEGRVAAGSTDKARETSCLSTRDKMDVVRMVGISAYGVHIPACRISAGTIAGEWNLKAGDGEKAVAGFDEDSLTMAVNAVLKCIEGANIDGLLILLSASTTSPFQEKQTASTIAIASDLRPSVMTADFSSSMRSGTTAMIMAADIVRHAGNEHGGLGGEGDGEGMVCRGGKAEKAGKKGSSEDANQALIVASDMRDAKPGSDAELMLGDCAVSLLLENSDDTLADIICSHSINDEYSEVWKAKGDEYLKFDDDVRFSRTFGYARIVNTCLKQFLDREKMKSGEISKAILCAPDGRSQSNVAKAFGFTPDQIPDNLVSQVGFTGSPHPLLLLASTLEHSKPDDVILLTGYGNGCDAILLRVNKAVSRLGKEKKLRKCLDVRTRSLTYAEYLSYRKGLGELLERLHPFASTSLEFRDRERNLRLHGKTCTACETVLTLPLKVCPHCGTREAFKDFKLSKRGKVVTYTQEHYYPTPEPPVTMAVIDLDGGGRLLLQMTDSDPNRVRVGMEVELTFRKLHEGGGFPNYYWKCASKTKRIEKEEKDNRDAAKDNKKKERGD